MTKKRFGDRSDGRRLRSLDPMFTLVPYIMRSRLDSQNLFEFDIPLSQIEKYLHEKRTNGFKRMSILHIVLAAAVRMYSQKPALNRFVAGNRIFARNSINISIAIKKQMTEKALETTIKFDFKPTDTLLDIYNVVNKAIDENKGEETQNDTDFTAKVITMLPPVLIRTFVWLMRSLDSVGLMPKALIEVSPFHTGLFITDLGSLGIQPVYHHLYEFGTTTIFLAFGSKYRKLTVDENEEVGEEKHLSFRVTADERICDGFTYAMGFKLLRGLLLHPERLEQPPEQVIEDVN